MPRATRVGGTLATLCGVVSLAVVGPLAGDRQSATGAGRRALPGRASQKQPEEAVGGKRSAGTNDILAPLRVIQTFFTTGESDLPSSKTSVEQTIAQLCEAASGMDYRLRFAISLVPDPLDSQIGAAFDQSLSAIERAASSVGWLRDRHWLPWQDDAKASQQPVRSGAAGSPSADEPRTGDEPAPGFGKSHSRQPGVLLFRSPEPPNTLLVILLVGESHITGVQKKAFQVALETVSLFLSSKPDVVDRRQGSIDILGPTFSGTAESIRLALMDSCKEKPSLRLRPLNFLSGSATSEKVQTILASVKPVCGIGSVRFQATVVPDHLALRAALGYFVDQLGWRNGEIALLTEADSLYGLGSKTPSEQPRWRLLLPVPSGTADVRSALEHSRSSNASVPPAKGLRIPSLALDLRLDESGSPTDSIRSFGSMSAPLSEMNVNRLLATLTRERIRHVGLFLTDVRDKLFFAERIKTYAHSMSLFTFEANLLYTHPREFPFLRGMLVVSSYPLSTETQQLFTPSPNPTRMPWTRMQFSSDVEEGIYNAAVIALERSPTPEQTPPVFDYVSRARGDRRAPAVWISAVGQDRLIPVAALRDYDSKSSAAPILTLPPWRLPRSLPPEVRGFASRIRVPAPFRFLTYLGTCLLLLLYVNCLVGFAPWTERRRRFLQTNPLFRPLIRSSLRDRRQWYVFMTAFVILTTWLWLALASVYLFPFAARRAFVAPRGYWGNLLGFQIGEERIMHEVVGWLPAVSLLIGIALVVVVWRIGSGLPAPEEPPRPSPRFQTDEFGLETLPSGKAGDSGRGSGRRYRVTLPFRLLLCGAAAVAAVIGLYFSNSYLLELASDFPRADRLLLQFLRLSSGPGGLSPLVGPFVIGVGLLASIAFQLRRLHIHDSWRPSRVFYAGFQSADPSVGTAAPLYRDIEALIRQPIPSTPWLWGPFLVLVLPLLTVILIWLEPVCESPPWGYAFSALFSVLLLSVVASFTRFLSLWYALRRILQRHNMSQMLSTFERFSQEVEWGAMRAFGDKKRQSYSTVLGLARRLRQMCCRPDLDVLLPEGAAELIRHSRLTDEALAEALQGMAEGWIERERAARVEALRRLDIAAYLMQQPFKSAFVRGSRVTAATAAIESLQQERQDYIVLHSIGFIRYVFAQIRNSLIATTTGTVVLLLGLGGFEFQPQRSVYVLIWSLISLLTAWTIMVFVQMDRDTVLSKIGNTTPGQVNLFRGGVLRQVLTYAAAPVITLIVTQFPQIAQPLLGWLDPLLHLFQ